MNDCDFEKYCRKRSNFRKRKKILIRRTAVAKLRMARNGKLMTCTENNSEGFVFKCFSRKKLLNFCMSKLYFNAFEEKKKLLNYCIHVQIYWFGLVSTKSQINDQNANFWMTGVVCYAEFSFFKWINWQSPIDEIDLMLDSVNYSCCIDLQRYLWNKT